MSIEVFYSGYHKAIIFQYFQGDCHTNKITYYSVYLIIKNPSCKKVGHLGMCQLLQVFKGYCHYRRSESSSIFNQDDDKMDPYRAEHEQARFSFLKNFSLT